MGEVDEQWELVLDTQEAIGRPPKSLGQEGKLYAIEGWVPTSGRTTGGGFQAERRNTLRSPPTHDD